LLNILVCEGVMKVAILAPWLLTFGGAEKVVAVLADMYPQADIFAMFGGGEKIAGTIGAREVKTSFLNQIPAIPSLYRPLIALHPLAVESLDLRGYDLVLSCDAGLMKGVLVDQDAMHICYCHTPVRYIWDLYRMFQQQIPSPVRPFYALIAQWLRVWDFNAAQRVDLFVANSRHIQQRIQKCYRRESTVIYPPVETARGYTKPSHDDYYLSVGRLSHTKRLDLLIEACNHLGRRLVIVGQGREEKRLQKMAGPTIDFRGRVSEEELPELYANCRAFLFAAEEDFGIVPVEAQSYGRPVLAYGRGGALETVKVSPQHRASTGLYFSKQTVGSVVECILSFEEVEARFDPALIRAHAQQFDTAIFRAKMNDFVLSVMDSDLSTVNVSL
jgi:glycosyltransferase involved in cell wall biosynthesis